MQIIDRTPIATGDPVIITEMQENMRLDADLVTCAHAYSQTAAREIETYCALALLDQTITCATDNLPGCDVALPIGPVAADATITVDLIEMDGTTTPGGRLRVTYPAGYGATSGGIPADLRKAICDLSARLYDFRASGKAAAMPAATARICARYRRVAGSTVAGSTTRQSTETKSYD